MEIKKEAYSVVYSPDEAVVSCSGRFRLRGVEEYAPIFDILMSAAEKRHSVLTLDLRALEFLNSSGISTLSKFALKLRGSDDTKLVIQANSAFPWQKKSLMNFQRLLPEMELIYS